MTADRYCFRRTGFCGRANGETGDVGVPTGRSDDDNGLDGRSPWTIAIILGPGDGAGVGGESIGM